MKSGYSETRPNGKAVEPGTLCWIIDLEDGTAPIAIYGKDADEIMGKLALQNAHAQMALVRRAAPPAGNPPAAPAPGRRVITADEVMKATTDLENPAKAGSAITTLVEAHTGLDLNRLVLDSFAKMAMEWQAEHPEFFVHPGNKRLLAEEAAKYAGGNLGKVTKEHLNVAFRNLQAQGYLMEAPPLDPNNPPPSTDTFPDESQVQRTERPRGTHFATGARSTSFQRPGAPTRTLKYTEEQIRKMPLAESRRLIEINDQDYADACDRYFGSQATA